VVIIHRKIQKKDKEKGDHPEEDLAKSGYEPRGPNMKHKSLIITLYFWLHTENKI